jgi:preprotein translocase subunit YajC
MFLISDALAATGAAPAQGDGTMSMVMIGVVFVLFYFVLIRPQNKRAKEHRDLLGKLKKGDEVVTSGGILAKIVEVDEQFLRIALTSDVEIMVQRSAISSILPKGTIKNAK